MKESQSIRVVYAANRAIGVRGLELLRAHGIEPIALLVPDGVQASHVVELKAALAHTPLFDGKQFRDPSAVSRLAALTPDYILSVHYPYLFTPEVLAVPSIGTLNLHPALLPFNRGWNTPSWAILEGTPIGATLHWVNEGVDSGDIALQRELAVQPDDTAHTLYQRLLASEIDLLAEALPLLKERRLPRTPQRPGGSFHRKADLARIQSLDGDTSMRATIDRLRALTTSNLDEAAYFTVDGRRYRVRVEISET